MEDDRNVKRKLKMVFWIIEINLFFWLMVNGGVWMNREHSANVENEILPLHWISFIGFIFAACAQHWSYYNLRNALKSKSL